MKDFWTKEYFPKAGFLVAWLMLWTMLFADERGRMHLEQACQKMATQTMQVTERVTQGPKVTEYLTWQQRNPDGTVKRMTEQLVDGERLDPETLKIGQHVFRTYYTQADRTSLRIGKNTIRGIYRRQGIPKPKYRKECEITEGKRIYEGRFCWDILVKSPTGDGILTEEYLVDGAGQMISVYRKFNANGQLLVNVNYLNYDFSPSFPDGAFELPDGVVVRELGDGEAEDDLREELKEEEQAEKEALYEHRNSQNLKADLRYWAQGAAACLLTMATWAGVPLALLVVALALHRRRRMARGRN